MCGQLRMIRLPVFWRDGGVGVGSPAGVRNCVPFASPSLERIGGTCDDERETVTGEAH